MLQVERGAFGNSCWENKTPWLAKESFGLPPKELEVFQDKPSIGFIVLGMYRPGSQRGDFAARRRWLPGWCVEEQKWCSTRCRGGAPGSLPGRCSYRLRRGERPRPGPAPSPVVTPKKPVECSKKGTGEWERPTVRDPAMQNRGRDPETYDGRQRGRSKQHMKRVIVNSFFITRHIVASQTMQVNNIIIYIIIWHVSPLTNLTFSSDV